MATNTTNHTTEFLISVYYTSQLVSCVVLLVLSVLTVVGNGLLLLATWKDPFKSFKNPSSNFVLSLGLANLLIGLVLEPLLIYAKLMVYLKRKKLLKDKTFGRVNDVGLSVSIATLNASFLTVLALTWCQVLAVASPHRYKAEITSTKTMLCVCCVWCYTTLFSLLPTMGVRQDLTVELDLHINTTLVVVALVLGYFALYKAYRTHLQSQTSTRSGTTKARRKSHKQFTILNLFLAGFVIVFCAPVAVVGHVSFYWLPFHPGYRYHHLIASIVANDILLMKFALDPIAYALRLPKYRLAFRSILRRSSSGVPQGSHLGLPASPRRPTMDVDGKHPPDSKHFTVELEAQGTPSEV